jgi:hypothetical protein
MKKYIRKHIKDEKRILKLMYKKGIINELVNDIEDCGWAYLLKGNRQRSRNGSFNFYDYLPEFHLHTTDYWGDGDSRSLVNVFRENIMMANADFCVVKGLIKVNKSVEDAKGLIKYLNSLPTTIRDNKFNKYLKVIPEE